MCVLTCVVCVCVTYCVCGGDRLVCVDVWCVCVCVMCFEEYHDFIHVWCVCVGTMTCGVYAKSTCVLYVHT